MRIITVAISLAAFAVGTPVLAAHLDNLTTPYASRGACEGQVAQFNAEVRDGLLDSFPQFFSRNGDVASFLTRAFTCEYDPSLDAWFIRDHRGEVLFSDWFQNKP